MGHVRRIRAWSMPANASSVSAPQPLRTCRSSFPDAAEANPQDKSKSANVLRRIGRSVSTHCSVSA
jgi:hypothetical protein